MTNNKQQTALDWYIIKRDEIEMKIRLRLICANQYEQELIKADEQAKEMEKERTINFTEDWYFNGPLLGEGIDVKNTIEQHFNNTYGGGNK